MTAGIAKDYLKNREALKHLRIKIYSEHLFKYFVVRNVAGSEVLYILVCVSLIWSFKALAGKNRHVFHLVDARNHKLLPGDKQLLHLLAKAQRRSVRYTIVITKIDVCTPDVMNIFQIPLLFAWGVILKLWGWGWIFPSWEASKLQCLKITGEFVTPLVGVHQKSWRDILASWYWRFVKHVSQVDRTGTVDSVISCLRTWSQTLEFNTRYVCEYM